MSPHGPPRTDPPDDDRTLIFDEEPPRAAPSAPPGGAKGRLRRAAVRLGKALLAVLLGFYVMCVLLLVVYRFVEPPVTGVQLERRIEAWADGREYEVEKDPVELDDLPRHVGRAVAAAEDGSFWKHRGFDLEAMRQAGEEAVEGEGLRGASTLTQQLMKNLFGCTCRNPVRKLYDLALTPVAELVLGKERILELYLNQVEWGPGVFGIEAAARHHYGVPASELTRTQAAGLAALLPGPLRRTPGNTAGYRREILRRMKYRGW